MEDKEALKDEYNKKVYSKLDRNKFVTEAFAQGQNSFFEVFKPHVEDCIRKALLDFLRHHKDIFPDTQLSSQSFDAL